MYELPLFPLNTVLFPGMPLQLHVFEERYRMLVQRVLTTNQTFGISLIRSGAEALGPLPEPYEIGCTARVMNVEPLEDGRLNLTVVGDERYRIMHVGTNQPFLTAFVENLPLDTDLTSGAEREVQALRPQVVSYLTLLARHIQQEHPELVDPDEPRSLDLTGLQLPENPLMMVYMAAALLQVPAREKQPLLEVNSAMEMLSGVQRLYRRELAILPPMLEMTSEQARASAWVN